MSNVNFNRLLFQLFWEQNAEKTFDDFGTLEGYDKKYIGIKLKDIITKPFDNSLIIQIDSSDPLHLCTFNFKNCKFECFEDESKVNINILDHISFEDKL